MTCPFALNLFGFCADWVMSVAISADGATCVSGSDDKTMRCACAHGTQALFRGVA